MQWEQNEGNCGVCGDPYQMKEPRPHEAGGEYAKGIISRFYTAGQVCYCCLFVFRFICLIVLQNYLLNPLLNLCLPYLFAG